MIAPTFAYPIWLVDWLTVLRCTECQHWTQHVHQQHTGSGAERYRCLACGGVRRDGPEPSPAPPAPPCPPMIRAHHDGRAWAAHLPGAYCPDHGPVTVEGSRQAAYLVAAWGIEPTPCLACAAERLELELWPDYVDAETSLERSYA